MVTQAPPSNPTTQAAPPDPSTITPPPADAGVSAPPDALASPPPESTTPPPSQQVETPPPVVPTPLPADVQWQFQYEVSEARRAHEQAVADLGSRYGQYVADLQADGVSQERAVQLAAQAFGPQQAQLQRANAERTRAVAISILRRQYGIPESELTGITDPNYMEAHAKNWKGRAMLQAENQRLKAQLEKVTKSLTPPTSYQGGPQAGASVGAATRDNIDALYVRWDIEHPNEPNPYERQYRQILRG